MSTAKFGTLYHLSTKPEEAGSLEKTIADLVKASKSSPDAREAIAFKFTEEGVPHSHGVIISRESDLASALEIPKSLLAEDKEPLELKILGSKIVPDKAPHVKYGLRVICKAKDPEAVRAFWSSAQQYVEKEPHTYIWLAYEVVGKDWFGVFDAHITKEARDEHLEGEIPRHLLNNKDKWLSEEPDIRDVDILATRLSL